MTSHCNEAIPSKMDVRFRNNYNSSTTVQNTRLIHVSVLFKKLGNFVAATFFEHPLNIVLVFAYAPYLRIIHLYTWSKLNLNFNFYSFDTIGRYFICYHNNQVRLNNTKTISLLLYLKYFKKKIINVQFSGTLIRSDFECLFHFSMKI